MDTRAVGRSTSRNVIILGGVLLGLGYLFWILNLLAPHIVPGSSDTVVSYSSLVVYGLATVLLAFGVMAVIRNGGFEGALALGAWLLVAGFLLWALGAVTSVVPVRLPWWFLHLSPLAIFVGSILFCAAGYATGTLNRSVVLLVGLGGALGMLLIDGPGLVWDVSGVDLTPGPVVHALGYLLLLAFGVGWIVFGRSRQSLR